MSYLALKFRYINKTQAESGVEKSLFSGAENSLFQFCLIITKPFSPFYLKEMKNYYSLSVAGAVSQVIMRIY